MGNTLALKQKDINDRLTALAAATGRTKSFYARQAILEHLEDLEDSFRADRALAEWRRSGEPLVSMEELVAEIGL